MGTVSKTFTYLYSKATNGSFYENDVEGRFRQINTAFQDIMFYLNIVYFIKN